MQTIKIGENQAGQRLDKALRKMLPQAGTGFLYKMLRKKNITLNGKKAEGNETLAAGDEIQCFFAEETFAKFSGGTRSLSSESAEYRKAYDTLRGIRILYEDEDVLIADKPAGVLSQKAVPSDSSLNEWLLGYLLQSGKLKEEELSLFRPSVCNRLDRNTSGIVLCGRSLAGSRELGRLLRTREIRKFYHAVCVGELRESRRIEGYLTKDAETNKVFISPEASDAAADPICTAYRPLRVRDGFTLLEVELITGKPHQIRAHLAEIGHPVLGDFKYGNSDINRRMRDRFGLRSQLLHAYLAVFPQEEHALPKLSGRTFQAPYPELFERIADALRLL